MVGTIVIKMKSFIRNVSIRYQGDAYNICRVNQIAALSDHSVFTFCIIGTSGLL